jgi:RND family efflux transporter MFP subunit
MKPALSVLAVAAALLSACSRPQPMAEAPRPVLVHTLAPAPAPAGALYFGEVRARYESDLAFRVAGKIVERRVDVGAAVKPGQVLARLDPADAALALEAARAQRAAAQNEFVFAKAEVERYRDLVEKNFVSRSVLDAKETAFRSAAARVEQARAQAGVAEHQAAYTRLVADQAGVITTVSAEVGQVVRESVAVMKLAHDGEREVSIAVPEGRIAALRQAGPVGVRLAAEPDATLAGRVREIAPGADPATRTYAVRVTIIDPPAALRLGMTASVILPDAGSHAGTLLVPAGAVFEHRGGSAVWIMQPDGPRVRAVLRQVEVRQFREDGVLLSAGVKPGETVAVAGVHKIVAGQLLQPVSAPSGG